MFCRGEFEFETESRTFRFYDIKEICRLCMFWENTLLQLFGNSENLHDKIHAFCILTEVSNCMSRMTSVFFPSRSDVTVLLLTCDCTGICVYLRCRLFGKGSMIISLVGQQVLTIDLL